MLLMGLFKRVITRGTLTIVDARGISHQFGDGTGDPVRIRFHNRGVEWRILRSPSLGAGESYMDGSLTIEHGSLYDLLDVFSRGLAVAEPDWATRWRTRIGMPLRRIMQYNSHRQSRRNVAHHYDLSAQLYDLFLDADRQYSCAYYMSPDDDLETAQNNKKRHVAAKLLLRPNQKILDIGSGWGGLGLYLAGEFDTMVDGITLSTEQHALSRKRAIEANLEDKARFHLQDYRTLQGTYDRIVSVGMFEHVGVGNYREYFDKMRALLAPDGVALLHTIGRIDGPGVTDPFIRRYIFPGGYTPALSELMAVIEQSGLFVTDIEVLRLHYAETLRAWRKKFLANWDQAKAIYDERFCRMWEFYLAGSEVTFRHMGLVVYQVQLARRQEAVPLTRDYIVDLERADGRRQSVAA